MGLVEDEEGFHRKVGREKPGAFREGLAEQIVEIFAFIDEENSMRKKGIEEGRNQTDHLIPQSVFRRPN